MADRDPYFDLSEVSNSDLSWLQKYWMSGDLVYDIEQAYRFGHLLDAMITENHKVNYFKLTCNGEQYTKKEFELAEKMKAAFWKDQFCRILAEHSEMQKILIVPRFKITHGIFSFHLDVRCKFDLYAKDRLKITGDIKSTTAVTQKQFIAACEHFQYFRQRAWYMDLAGVDKDMLIGISKVNHQVFKVPITRGDRLYNIGKAQYEELAWKWHYLFGDITETKIIDLETLKIAV